MKKTNLTLRELVEVLHLYARRFNANIWASVAEELEKPSRRLRVVNVSKINRYTEPNDYVIVPGKVLGAGELDHPVTVAAFSFSKTAIDKITRAGGRVISIFKLLEERPTGSNVKIIG